jgi:poly(3-hydroxybutyrate) depolymerase
MPNDGGAGDSGMGRLDASSATASGDGGDRTDSGSALPAVDAGDGGNSVVKPSAGCGRSGRPSGGRVSVQGKRNYTFPATYDGARPLPLLIGFHAANNPIEQIENLTKGSDLDTGYVRAFPKSKGSAWDYDADIGEVIAMYDDLMANYCIDTSRVFGTGHSSGAQLIVQLLTPAHRADADHLAFKAVAPVAASRYGTVSRAIPVLYIQAQLDTVRNSSGADVVREFVSANGCAMTSKAYAATPSCMSSGKTVMNGCIQYDGCKTATVWCSHDDPQYSSTFHGWPCFATKTMSGFFASLP